MDVAAVAADAEAAPYLLALVQLAAVAAEPRQPSAEACAAIRESALRHAEMAKVRGVATKPKLHSFLHASFDVGFQGNPNRFQTYFDESLNHLLCTIAKNVHRLTFERRLFAKFHRAQSEHLMARSKWW